MALLREIYGPGVEKLKIDVRPFKFKSSTVEITFISSNYHLEMNPSDVGPYRSATAGQHLAMPFCPAVHLALMVFPVTFTLTVLRCAYRGLCPSQERNQWSPRTILLKSGLRSSTPYARVSKGWTT